VNEIIKKMALLIQEHLSDIRSMGTGVEYSSFLADKKLRKAIEWSIVSAVELCINIGRHVISEKGFRVPENNREVFQILFENGLIDETTLENMKKAVGYRNMAIHRYGDIDSNTTFVIMKKNHTDIEGYIEQILKQIESENE